MKRFGTHLMALVIMAGTLVCIATGAHAAVTIDAVKIVDVTPSGFSVIARTAAMMTPVIRVYADAAGTEEITGELAADIFPMRSGDPAALDPFQHLLSVQSLRNAARAKGLLKASVHGCTPGGTYHFRVEMTAGGVVVGVWPVNGLIAVTTPLENAFVMDSAAVQVRLTASAQAIDTSGWLVTATAAGSPLGISAYAGDGAPVNQAYLNLSRLFGADGLNLMAGTPQTVTVDVMSPGEAALQRTVDVPFDGTFRISGVHRLDVVVDDILDADEDGLSLTGELAAGTDPAKPDTDGDTLPDGWEVEFGTQALIPDADQDPDNDTFTNIEEYRAGSDPNDPASTPAATGDINGDKSLDLADAILAIQIVSGITPTVAVHKSAAIGGDGRIGMDAVVFLLQKIAGVRP